MPRAFVSDSLIQGFVPETGFVPWTSLGWPRASVICLISLPTQREPAAMRPGMIGGERPCVGGSAVLPWCLKSDNDRPDWMQVGTYVDGVREQWMQVRLDANECG